jgi:5-hydroxyisourate hydrolase-like protein (transthyretin family)
MTKKRIAYAVCTVFLLFMFYVGCRSDCPVYFKSPSLSGTVVDIKSGKPMADVSVKVRWSAMRRTANMHNPDCMDIKVATTVTDTNGVFTVPAWGPITLTGGWYYCLTDPEAYFAKSGHDLGMIYNRTYPGYQSVTPFPFQTVIFEKPSWNGQKIPKPFVP